MRQSPTFWKQCTVLGIVPKGSSYTICRNLGFLALVGPEPTDFDIGPRRILPGSINYSHVKSLMYFCGEQHLKCCILLEPTVLSRLRAIDCVTRSVIQAPEGCQYLALSYVWGDQGHAAAVTRGRFTSVAEDSIMVTMNLGFRYLWVDRHVGCPLLL